MSPLLSLLVALLSQPPSLVIANGDVPSGTTTWLTAPVLSEGDMGGIVFIGIRIRCLVSCLVNVPFMVSVGLTDVVHRTERYALVLVVVCWCHPPASTMSGSTQCHPRVTGRCHAAWLRLTCVVVRNQYSLVRVEEVTMFSLSVLHMTDHQLSVRHRCNVK